MGVKTLSEAISHSESLARRALTGSRVQKKRYQGQAAFIGEAIYRRFQIGPTKWRSKHVIWFFDEFLHDRSRSTKYQYWLACKAVLKALDRFYDMEPHIQGSWVTPKEGPLSESTKGRRQKLRRRIDY